jgi:hypothetical protein
MPRSRRTALLRGVAVALGAASLLAPAVANSKLPATDDTSIVPHQSMAGVKLDMTRGAVTRAWGKGTCPVEGFCEYQIKKPQFVGQYERAVVSYYKNKVIMISLQGAFTEKDHKLVPGALSKWKTSKGIHLGSKKSAVHKAYPQAKPGGGEAGEGYIWLKGSGRNETITSFTATTIGPSTDVIASISIAWSNCHYDPNTTC